MRKAFIQTLTALAEEDTRIMLLTADLGYSVVDTFASAHPKRFLNLGVAEQNTLGVATGLAADGLLPFVYSITPFAVFRPYEFIRNGPVLHSLPVRIVGVGAGVEYGANGPTHYALEDIGVTRALPGLGIVAPADARQASAALSATYDDPGPVYYRLGKDDSRVVPGLSSDFSADGTSQLHPGDAVALVVTGAIAVEAELAARRLAADGISTACVVVARLSPPPVDFLRDVLRRCKLVVTVEAHYIVGGLGSLVAEIAAPMTERARVVRLGFEQLQPGVSGPEHILLQAAGLDAASIHVRVREAWEATT